MRPKRMPVDRYSQVCHCRRQNLGGRHPILHPEIPQNPGSAPAEDAPRQAFTASHTPFCAPIPSHRLHLPTGQAPAVRGPKGRTAQASTPAAHGLAPLGRQGLGQELNAATVSACLAVFRRSPIQGRAVGHPAHLLGPCRLLQPLALELRPAPVSTGLRGFDLRRRQVTMLRAQAQGVPAVQGHLTGRLAGRVCFSSLGCSREQPMQQVGHQHPHARGPAPRGQQHLRAATRKPCTGPPARRQMRG